MTLSGDHRESVPEDHAHWRGCVVVIIIVMIIVMIIITIVIIIIV